MLYKFLYIHIIHTILFSHVFTKTGLIIIVMVGVIVVAHVRRSHVLRHMRHVGLREMSRMVACGSRPFISTVTWPGQPLDS